MSAAVSRAPWYANGLRWIGSLLAGAARHLEQRSADYEMTDPWPGQPSPQERVTELRNRVHFY